RGWEGAEATRHSRRLLPGGSSRPMCRRNRLTRERPRRGRTKRDPHTASLAAFTGRTLRLLRAGFALNTVGSLVKGLMPVRSLVAGFLMTTNLAKPGR